MDKIEITYNQALEELQNSIYLNRTQPHAKPNWEDKTDLFVKHYKKWDYFQQSDNFGTQVDQGKLFLYETCIQKDGMYQMSYPKLGIYLHSMICDQTLEIEWVDYRRTIEYKKPFKYQTEWAGKIHDSASDLSEVPTKIKSIILWDDSMYVYGVWKTLPDYTTLKRAYENTWWFHKTVEEKRDLRIDQIV